MSVVDDNFKDFPGLEEASWQHGDTLAGGSLNSSASMKEHVITGVALEQCPMIPPLHQLSGPCDTGMPIGGVDKCHNAGYQGAGNS